MENQEKLEEMKDVKVEKKDEKLDAEKVQEIVKKAKTKGKITYEELAKELENTNPDQIDKVFDAFEEMGGLVGHPLIELQDLCGNRVITKIKWKDFKKFAER